MAKGNVKGFGIEGLNFDKEYFTEDDIDQIVKAVGLPVEGDIEIAGVDEETEQETKEQIPKRLALKLKLQQQAVLYFGWYEPNEQRPSPKQVEKTLSDIEAAADQLIQKVFVDNPPKRFANEGPDRLEDIPYAVRTALEGAATKDADQLGNLNGLDTPDKNAEDLFGEALEHVYRLRNWAAESRKALDVGDGQTGYRGDTGINSLIDGLIEHVWKPVFDMPATTSVNEDGFAYGPLIEFVKQVFKTLNIVGRDGAPFESDAIRSRIRNVNDQRLAKSEGKAV